MNFIEKTLPKITVFGCLICKNAYTTKFRLNRHLEIAHSDQTMFLCHVCDKTYLKRIELKKHYAMSHENREKCVHCKTRDRQTCNICQGTFASDICLKSHIKEVHGPLRYQCHICERRFARHQNLKRHKRTVHDSLRPYTCDVCNKSFSYRDILNKHTKCHKRKSTTLLQRLGRNISFTSHKITNLKMTKSARIELKQLQKKKFACPLCTRTFSLRSHLKLHKRHGHSTTTNRGSFTNPIWYLHLFTFGYNIFNTSPVIEKIVTIRLLYFHSD